MGNTSLRDRLVKILEALSSRYPKYPEVPMCGTPLAADTPDEFPESIRSVVIELDVAWSDQKIAKTLCWWLDHGDALQQRAQRSLESAALYTREQCAPRLLREARVLRQHRTLAVPVGSV